MSTPDFPSAIGCCMGIKEGKTIKIWFVLLKIYNMAFETVIFMIKKILYIGIQMRFILIGDLIGHDPITFEVKIKGCILF